MTKEERIKEQFQDKDFVFLRGFDNAILGTAWSNGVRVICYSIPRMVNELVVFQKMTKQEANEWLDHNTLYAYFGDHTPVYLEEL